MPKHQLMPEHGSVSMKTFVYKTAGSCRIRVDVHAKAEWIGARGKRPGIIWIHGGALICGDRSSLSSHNGSQLSRYLSAGFVVASIDYRLAPQVKLTAIVEDVDDACDWVRAHAEALGIDPSRIAAIGHSAGGYLSLVLGSRAVPPLSAVVSFYGYGDITGRWYAEPDPFYGTFPRVPRAEARAVAGGPIVSHPRGATSKGRGRFYLYCRQRGLWPKEVVGYHVHENRAAFEPYRPVRHVTRNYPPTLLLHGSSDTDVPCAQSTNMAAALARAGVPHELVIAPGGGHGQDEAFDFERVLAFLKRHVSA
jgi:acetyl esterase/lipase